MPLQKFSDPKKTAGRYTSTAVLTRQIVYFVDSPMANTQCFARVPWKNIALSVIVIGFITEQCGFTGCLLLCCRKEARLWLFHTTRQARPETEERHHARYSVRRTSTNASHACNFLCKLTQQKTELTRNQCCHCTRCESACMFCSGMQAQPGLYLCISIAFLHCSTFLMVIMLLCGRHKTR